jgi:hypothetical protein
MFPTSPIQPIIDWLSERWDILQRMLDPVIVIIRIALMLASYLPEPDSRLQPIIDDAVAALGTVVKYVSLADYIINLPVWLLVIAIIVGVETALTSIRMWRFLRSLVI